MIKAIKVIGGILLVALLVGLGNRYFHNKVEQEKYLNLYGSDDLEKYRMKYYIDKEMGYTDEEIRTKSAINVFLNDYNSKCPIDFDSQILKKVDGSFAPDHMRVNYHFTLKNQNHEDVDWLELNSQQRKSISDLYQTSEDFEIFRKGNVSLNYMYYDQNEKFGTMVSVP